MTDMIRYKHGGSKDKVALVAKWRDHKWSNDEMREWALWNWKEVVG